MGSRASHIFGTLAVASTAMLLLSCGGSLGDSVTGPTPALEEPGLDLSDDVGEVTAFAADKVRVCHKGKDLWVAPSALQGHLKHGDKQGSCNAAACPCFSQADIEAAASGCSNLMASCPAAYSLGLFCAPGGTGGTVGNLGYWEALVGLNSCSWTVWDPVTGNEVTQTLPLDAAQFEACRAAITNSSAYPASCPQ